MTAPLQEKLLNVEWGEYRLGELFNVSTTKGFNENTLKLFDEQKKGLIEFVGRTNSNNGIKGFIEKNEYEPNKPNTISVSQIGTIVAQLRTKEWYSSQNIFSLSQKDGKYNLISLFIVSVINKFLSDRFSGGYSDYPNLESLRELSIILPTKNGEIDFDFMESFVEELETKHVEELETKHVEELETYLKTSGLNDYVLTEDEEVLLENFIAEKIELTEFKLGDLFDTEKWVYGKDQKYSVISESPIANGYSVISGTTRNNGVDYYTKDIGAEMEVFQNELTINTRGDSGHVFFHPEKFVLANNVLVMRTPNWSINQKIFLGCLINKLHYNGYNNYPTKDSLKEDIVKLPTKNGEIDFDFMEKFVLVVTKLVIKNLVLHNNEKVSLLKKLAS